MKFIGRYLAAAAAVALLSAGHCFGWAESWEDVKAAAGEISSISASFIQEKHMKVLARPLLSEGLLFFQTPHSLRWEYRRPIQSILIAHAGKTKKFIHRNGAFIPDAATSAPAMQFVVEEISRWLKGRFDENPAFTAVLEPGRRILLTPSDKSLADMIARIELVLSQHPGVIEMVTIYESEHSYTRLIFQHVEINRPLDRRLFEEIP